MLKIPLLNPKSISILKLDVPLDPCGVHGCPFNKNPKVFLPSLRLCRC